jgi:hypothetical protein
MRKPSTLWRLVSHDLTFNHKGLLVLRLTFQRYGFNHHALNKFHVIEIPIFKHKVPQVNLALSQGVLRVASTERQNQAAITDIVFSKAKMPGFWVLDGKRILNAYHKKEKAIARIADLAIEEINEIWELVSYRFDYRGKPMSVVLQREESTDLRTIDIPLFKMPRSRFEESIRLGLNDVSKNQGNKAIPNKTLFFSFENFGYKILEWWTFNSQMRPGECHVSKTELINGLHDTPCM